MLHNIATALVCIALCVDLGCAEHSQQLVDASTALSSKHSPTPSVFAHGTVETLQRSVSLHKGPVVARHLGSANLPKDAWEACLQFSLMVVAPGNIRAGASGPSIPIRLAYPPGWYQWKSAACVVPYESPEFTVTCRRIRYQGNPVLDGAEIDRPGKCGPEEVCVPGFAVRNGYGRLGMWNTIACVPSLHAKFKRLVAQATKIVEWCSPEEFLGSLDVRRDTAKSWMVTMELDNSEYPSELWFEIKADWWKYRHQFALQHGSVASGVINTAPSLGDTYVRFCTRLTADTVHKIIPVVILHYSWSILNNHRQHRFSESGDAFDVQREPL